MDKFTNDQMKIIEAYAEVVEKFGRIGVYPKYSSENEGANILFLQAYGKYEDIVPEEIRKSFIKNSWLENIFFRLSD